MTVSVSGGTAAALTFSVPFTLSQPDASTNRIGLEVTAFGLSDSDATDLSGVFNAALDLQLSPTSAEVVGLRFTQGQIAATDLDLDFRFLVTVASIDGTNLGAALETTVPGFSPVTAGQFPTEDHQVVLNQGTLEVSGLITESLDLASDPVSFTQVGLGQVALQQQGTIGDATRFGVTLTLPLIATEMITDPEATIDAAGTIVATGEFSVLLPLTGDANRDGLVTAADYAVLRGLGESLSDWREQYGQVRQGSQVVVAAAVPESNGALGLVAGSLAILVIAGRDRTGFLAWRGGVK